MVRRLSTLAGEGQEEDRRTKSIISRHSANVSGNAGERRAILMLGGKGLYRDMIATCLDKERSHTLHCPKDGHEGMKHEDPDPHDQPGEARRRRRSSSRHFCFSVSQLETHRDRV